jgi:hypothetical protein
MDENKVPWSNLEINNGVLKKKYILNVSEMTKLYSLSFTLKFD